MRVGTWHSASVNSFHKLYSRTLFSSLEGFTSASLHQFASLVKNVEFGRAGVDVNSRHIRLLTFLHIHFSTASSVPFVFAADLWTLAWWSRELFPLDAAAWNDYEETLASLVKLTVALSVDAYVLACGRSVGKSFSDLAGTMTGKVKSIIEAKGGGVSLILSLAAVTIPVAVLVNRVVPDSYLDEEFHIKQVQHYCRGNFGFWDPKITTFPGLYIFSLLYSGAMIPVGLLFGITLSANAFCQPVALRSINIVFSLTCALLFREIIYHLDPDKNKFRASLKAFVLSLYPLHWFFNFLYYTELGSASAVMAMYLTSLKHAYWSSALVRLFCINCLEESASSSGKQMQCGLSLCCASGF